MSRHLRRLCTKPFQIRLVPHPKLPELSETPPKTLIRETTQTLRRLLQPHETPITLRGPKGVGKSTLLAQAVKHARSQNQLVLYIPSAQLWTHGPGFFAAAALPDKQPHLDGLQSIRFYDRPSQTAELLKVFLSAHSDHLKDVPSKAELRSDLTKDCQHLHSLVSLGIQLLDDIDSNWRMNPEYAGSILAQLLEELCESQVPAAIVIDDYTAMIGMTCMINERQKRLHANAIRVVAQHLGRGKIEDTAKRLNGPVVLASEDQPVFEEWRAGRVVGGVEFPIDNATRQDASGRVWWADFVKRVREAGNVVDVPPLQSGEQRALCATFAVGRERASDRLVALAGGRGDAMQRIYTTR